MKAVIWSLHGDPRNPNPIAEKTLEEGKVVITSQNRLFKEELLREGIIGINGVKYMPSEGKKFIEQLPYHFKSAYLRAELISD